MTNRHSDSKVNENSGSPEKQNDSWIFSAIKYLNGCFLLADRKSRHNVIENYRNKYWMCTNANSGYYNSSLSNVILFLPFLIIYIYTYI